MVPIACPEGLSAKREGIERVSKTARHGAATPPWNCLLKFGVKLRYEALDPEDRCLHLAWVCLLLSIACCPHVAVGCVLQSQYSPA